MITSVQAQQIAQIVSPIYTAFLAQYDFDTYPAANYHRYKTIYSSLQIPNTEIYNSLVWKWGHVGKDNFPSAHQRLIRRVEELWPEYVKARRKSPRRSFSAEETFQWWAYTLPLKTTRYITVAYITHLIHHAENIPIIDQHNFRAMNTLIRRVRSDHVAKSKPSRFDDIIMLKEFMFAILGYLPNTTFGELDRFLMMFGKSAKPRKPSKQRNIEMPKESKNRTSKQTIAGRPPRLERMRP